MTTLNLVPRFLKMLSHLATSYHILLDLITLSLIFDRKVMSMTTLNLAARLLKMLPHLATSYHTLSDQITLYPPSLIER